MTATVAPFTGAWIEIRINMRRPRRGSWSLPSRERGLKYVEAGGLRGDDGRSLHGSVD